MLDVDDFIFQRWGVACLSGPNFALGLAAQWNCRMSRRIPVPRRQRADDSGGNVFVRPPVLSFPVGNVPELVWCKPDADPKFRAEPNPLDAVLIF